MDTLFMCVGDVDTSESCGSAVNGYTALHWAVENGDLEMVCILLDHDADPNISASFDKHSGVTALHLASQVNLI
jgi:ankyrin repeat protein